MFKDSSFEYSTVAWRWINMGTWNEEVSTILILIVTRHQGGIENRENLQAVSYFCGKTEILWVVSESSDYGGAQWMAEVVEIGAWRILWLFWIQERHVCLCFSSGCQPNCDNPKGECPPQTTERLAHNITTQVILKLKFVRNSTGGLRLYRGILPLIQCTSTTTKQLP